MHVSLYVALMLALAYLLAWMGGEPLHGSPWPLIIYPLVRYAIYGAIAILLVTVVPPVGTFAIVLVISVLSDVLAPRSSTRLLIPEWVSNVVYFLLPSTGLLSEARFLAVQQSSLQGNSLDTAPDSSRLWPGLCVGVRSASLLSQ